MRKFELDDEEYEAAEDFIVGHQCLEDSGIVNGNISYEFTVTSIGIVILVKCGCGESENITDYSKW